MRLLSIDKSRYRKHYRIVFAAITAALIVIALTTSSFLIQWFGDPQGSNFSLNLVGVVVAVVVVSVVVFRLRQHSFMHEVMYVWNLKKQLNLIYRKQHKIEPLIEENDVDAMTIMNYMYRGSKQLYELDDNTITIDDLGIKMKYLDGRIEAAGLNVDTDDFEPSMLDRF